MSDFSVRPYFPEQDIPSLARLLTEIEALDRDGEDTSEEYLRSMVTWPNFDAAQNTWIAERDGNMVGFGMILPRPKSHSSMYIVVHPSQRRKGLGSTLLSLALSRARAAEANTFLVYATRQNAGSNSFLLQHGFEVVGTSGVMVAPVDSLPALEIPSGYLIRRYPEVGDPALVVQALDQCYKDMVGHGQNVTSADRYMNYYGSDGIHLLFDEKGVRIGICAGKPEGRTDERGISDLLDAPGLVKEHRGRGDQRFLTLAVMHWLREKAARPITLEYWGDDEQALAIYRELGFELVNEQITYQKDLE